jgi:ATP-dependent DNA helicase RecQ
VLDPTARGKVQRVFVADALHQAHFIAGEIERITTLDTSLRPSAFAVLGRTRDDLVVIRAVLEERQIAIDWRADEDVTISPFRIREIHAWLTFLETEKHAAWTAAVVREHLQALRGASASNRWWTFLGEIWSEWRGESGEAEVPVAQIREFFEEAVAERHRSRSTSDGVVLTTAHKAKGLEFPHVFVADGGWRRHSDAAAMEEERRVFYVAATRARETLAILVRKDRRTAFPYEMTGDCVVDRTPGPVAATHQEWIGGRHYAIVDPTELIISFAGQCPVNSPVHAALRTSCAGDAVRLVFRQTRIHIETPAGVPLAALSAKGRQVWQPRLESVRSARIVAMVRRTAEQEPAAYRDNIQVGAWEFPVIEVCWEASVD